LRLFFGVGMGESGSPETGRVSTLCDEVVFGDSEALTLEVFGLAFDVDEAVARAYDGGAIFRTGHQGLQVSETRIPSQYHIRRIIAAVNACGGIEEPCMTSTEG
jgi:hypothetical protein